MGEWSDILELTQENIESVVGRGPGNYRLGKVVADGSNLVVAYVGRADVDVREALLRHAALGMFLFFRVLAQEDYRDAYRQECEDYHRYKTPGNLVHPAPPQGVRVACPVCGEGAD